MLVLLHVKLMRRTITCVCMRDKQTQEVNFYSVMANSQNITFPISTFRNSRIQNIRIFIFLGKVVQRINKI